MALPAHEIGSGNIFADLGLPNAEEHQLKAALVVQSWRVSIPSRFGARLILAGSVYVIIKALWNDPSQADHRHSIPSQRA
jgi:hypothetical protein